LLVIPFLVSWIGFGEATRGSEEEPEAKGRPQGAAAPAEEKDTAPLIPYLPSSPERPAPDIRTTGGTRGIPFGLPDVILLVPDHVGLTLEAQPTLYWHLSSQSPVRIEITLIDLDGEGSVKPLLEVPAEESMGAGIHGFRIADHGLELQVGKTYQWSVAVVPDPERRASDKIARAFLARVEADLALRGALAEAESSARPRVLARGGIWYDALAGLSEAIAADPTDTRLRQERASLLEQVGLVELAARDRSAVEAR
jgi:hypothetical protein